MFLNCDAVELFSLSGNLKDGVGDLSNSLDNFTKLHTYQKLTVHEHDIQYLID
jgi:hypothetical protein